METKSARQQLNWRIK